MFYCTAQEFGLFLSDEDPKKGVWLESARTLEYYLLRNGVWCNIFSSLSNDIVQQCCMLTIQTHISSTNCNFLSIWTLEIEFRLFKGKVTVLDQK